MRAEMRVEMEVDGDGKKENVVLGVAIAIGSGV